MEKFFLTFKVKKGKQINRKEYLCKPSKLLQKNQTRLSPTRSITLINSHITK